MKAGFFKILIWEIRLISRKELISRATGSPTFKQVVVRKLGRKRLTYWSESQDSNTLLLSFY